MDITYKPYIDPEYELLVERIHPPRVCVDNDSYPDCTLVKVDSANKHGMLLEMVQILTDLDLVISKSYISSDGGWLMDVFHVTNQHGNKLNDDTLTDYIHEAICSSRRAWRDAYKTNIGREVQARHVSANHMALEVTGIDQRGVMSEILAVLAELACHVTAAVAWTHNKRAACVIYVAMDPSRAGQVRAQLENVVEAHHKNDELCSVKVAAPGGTHTERRLHQLLAADGDYEGCCSCCGGNNEGDDFYVYKGQKNGCDGTHVRIDDCSETGYSVINIRSRDRTKLLFDTVCVLTDLEYVVYHGAISSQGSTAFQEYYVKHKDGHILSSEGEKRMVTLCLIAAAERRVTHGLKLDICTKDRTRLLSDVTRVFRENGLSINRAEIGIHSNNAVGTFYVKDTTGENVSRETLEAIRQEIGGDISVDTESNGMEEKSKFSFGNLVWSQLERLSGNFGPIKS